MMLSSSVQARRLRCCCRCCWWWLWWWYLSCLLPVLYTLGGLGGFRHPLKSLQNPSWDSRRHSMTRTQLDLPFLSSPVVQQPQEGGRGTSWGSLSCPLPAGSTLPEKRSVQQVTSGQEGTPHLHPIPSGEGL